MTAASNVSSQSALAEALKLLVAELPTHFVDDPREVSAALRDRCPNAQPRDLAVLIDAAAHGIPARLRAAHGSAVSASGIAQRWAGASTIDNALALWAVGVWAQALDVKTLPAAATTTPAAADDVTITATATATPAKKRKATVDVAPRRRRGPVFWLLVAGGIVIAIFGGLLVYGDTLDHDRDTANAAGDAALRQQQWAAAQTAFARAAADDDNNEHAWYENGFTLCKLGRYEEGITSLQHAMTLAPQVIEPVLAIGGCRLGKGDAQGAFDGLDHAKATFPNDSSLWLDRGLALERLGRRADALASYQRALTIDPQNAAARSQIAHLAGSSNAR